MFITLRKIASAHLKTQEFPIFSWYYDIIITLPLWRDLVKILARKPRHASLDCTDLKKCNFKKIPEPLLRSLKSPRSNDLKTQNNENSKSKPV